MAKKIRFPLKMKNGAEVRSLEELKENFDLESVLGYFTDGKLVTWLADRYYDEKAAAVAALSADMPDFNAKLCEILEVEYQAEADETNIEAIQRRNEKLKIISAVTADQDILNNIDLVATDQEELYSILDEGSDKVYLYGEKFEIPFIKKNIDYIGVNKPLVILGKDKIVDEFEEDGITFIDVEFEESAIPEKYPDPVGKFKIENGVVIEGIPDGNGECIIPYGVICIGEKAFAHIYTREKIKSVTIPDSVTNINDSAFRWCQKLETINWGKSVINIGKNAFQDCHNLTIVVIPDSVRSIGESAFRGCTTLEKLVIPDSVISIGESAFYGCNNLSNVTLPINVSFKEAAFDDTPVELEMRKRLGYTRKEVKRFNSMISEVRWYKE